jgi:hypothetical protein
MSHYLLIVTGNDVAGQLAPFDENLLVPPYPHPDWSDALGVEHIQAKLSEWGSIPRQLEVPLIQLLNDIMKDGFIAGLRRNEAAFKA